MAKKSEFNTFLFISLSDTGNYDIGAIFSIHLQMRKKEVYNENNDTQQNAKGIAYPKYLSH